jgi:hypothetical protein
MLDNLVPAGTFLSEPDPLTIMLIALRKKQPFLKKRREKKHYPKPQGPHTRLEATASYNRYYAKEYKL